MLFLHFNDWPRPAKVHFYKYKKPRHLCTNARVPELGRGRGAYSVPQCSGCSIIILQKALCLL